MDLLAPVVRNLKFCASKGLHIKCKFTSQVSFFYLASRNWHASTQFTLANFIFTGGESLLAQAKLEGDQLFRSVHASIKFARQRVQVTVYTCIFIFASAPVRIGASKPCMCKPRINQVE